MRKTGLWMLLVVALLLAACAPAEPAAEPTPTRRAVPEGPPMACTLFSLFPDPRDPASVNLPPISADDWSRGPDNARLTILEYSDFQCPYCSLAGQLIGDFAEANPDQVRVVFRHFPLASHDKAQLAAQAAEAAGLQGKFWEMHNLLFEETNWQTWTNQSKADFEKWVVEQAATIQLDATRFSRELNSEAVVRKVEGAFQNGVEMGLQGTPSLFIFIDGELVFVPEDQVPYDPATLDAILKLANLRPLQFDQCPPVITSPDKEYTATLTTDKGDIRIKLFADKAPLAVNSFVFLAKMGYFDGMIFHRVLPDFVAQSGDPSSTGFGGPGYQFANEVSEEIKFDRAGLVGMANAGADTNGSQFFITYKETPQLDGGYTIFGEVIEGMEVVQALTPRDPATTAPADLPQGSIVLSVSIEEK
ncbi:MAG: peptidylprolyl isomerase [Chloroflexota bacterium]|jgi:cyclophilin family peptidyl-prolyl cis-trans isomerase/protein-disulfide isomerase